MRSSKSNWRTAPTIASSEDYLPGFAPSGDDIGKPDQQFDPTSRSGWWVKRSARQHIDAAGRPGGYRHTLMQGHTTIMSGVGSDCARTFQQQADFQNTRDEQALHQATTSSFEGPGTPARSLSH